MYEKNIVSKLIRLSHESLIGILKNFTMHDKCNYLKIYKIQIKLEIDWKFTQGRILANRLQVKYNVHV